MIFIKKPDDSDILLWGTGEYETVIIAGPCCIESRDMALRHAEQLARLMEHRPFVYKASYDKANRSSIHSFRGIGIERGLGVLAEIREQFNMPVLTDVHSPAEANMAAEVVDILQIPAFLCRQTDLLTTAAQTGKPINIKKGQFMPPLGMEYAADKVRIAGNPNVCVTERGTCFGHGDLVVDFRGIVQMGDLGLPVIFDATHSVQTPGAEGVTTGQRRFVEPLARAALAVGVAGLFFEVHEHPDQAKSDAATQVPLSEFGEMTERLGV